jgi:short-subunit dehydrogenase
MFDRATHEIVRLSYRSRLGPARAWRLLAAPSLERAVGGRVVLLTGASSGIGRVTALRLGAAGATLLLVARNAEALQAVAAEIQARGGRASVHPCDLRDPQAIDRLAAEVLDAHGHVDVLINNAGRSIRRPVDQSYERLHDFERTMQLNYFAAIRLTLRLLPSMRARRRGHIVNVGTFGVHTNYPRFAGYIASKAALDAFSRSLAIEVRGDGVRVTTVHPPLVRTPMTAATGSYDRAPALTADEAAQTIAEAITTRPTSLSPWAAAGFDLARLLAPGVVERAQSRTYQRSLATAGSPA